ncbi:MAG: hypothetical protein J5995_07725 [Muribaculaceae bacterium]|nr:hypothetical protein [Muribaculaceae bacterium]MBP3288625.1 hypothetical protein [Muribaculaceae bacterium]
MTKPRLVKVRALFYVLQQVTKKEAAPILTQPHISVCQCAVAETDTYIRRKLFGGDENCYLSLPMKKESEPAIAMPGHALFLAMDNFFR